MLENLVTLEEIEQSRTPSEYIAWFDAFLDKSRDRGNRRQILLHEGIAKQLYEEAFPLYRLLQHKKEDWGAHRFKHVLGNQAFDATVEPVCEGFSFLEITTADRDQEEVWRMQAFAERKSVPGLGPVTRSGTKRTGFQFELSDDAQLHLDLVEKKRRQLIEAIERKCRRAPSLDTALVIYFDDYVAFADPGDQTAMQGLLDSVRETWQRTYRIPYVVGASGKRFWPA